MRKLLQITFTLVLISGIPACKKDSLNGDCGGTIYKYFDIKGLQTEVIELKPKTKSAVLQAGDTIEEEHFNIQCNFETTFYSKSLPSFNLLSTQSAYALTCPPHGKDGSKEGIDTIFVITNDSLSSQYSISDTINNDVVVNYNGSDVYLSDYVNDNKTLIKRNYEDYFKQFIRIKLSTAVQNKTQPHSFTIVIRLGNGEVYTSTTPAIYFK